MPPVYNRAIGNVNLIVGRLLRACGCAPTGFKLRACRCAPAVGRREREVIVCVLVCCLNLLKVSLRSGSEMGVKRRRSDFFDSCSGLAAQYDQSIKKHFFTFLLSMSRARN